MYIVKILSFVKIFLGKKGIFLREVINRGRFCLVNFEGKDGY